MRFSGISCALLLLLLIGCESVSHVSDIEEGIASCKNQSNANQFKTPQDHALCDFQVIDKWNPDYENPEYIEKIKEGKIRESDRQIALNNAKYFFHRLGSDQILSTDTIKEKQITQEEDSLLSVLHTGNIHYQQINDSDCSFGESILLFARTGMPMSCLRGGF